MSVHRWVAGPALRFGTVRFGWRRLKSRPGRRDLLIGAAALVLAGALAWFATGGVGPGSATRAAAQAVPAVAAPSATRRVVAQTSPRGGTAQSETGAGSAVSSRVASASQAVDMFAPHSWHVDPPPPPPPPPSPPAVPSAPPFPYVYLGALTNDDRTVYFLSREDRVIDAHVGDRLDGVYEFVSADAGQLTFNYLPLEIRQTLSSGAKP